MFWTDSPLGHFRQICQFRDFYISRILAIFGKLAISFKNAVAISHHIRHFLAKTLCLLIWLAGKAFWGFFAILVNITIFVKITTFKGPLCHLIENFVTTGECSPYSLPIANSPFSPNMPLSSKSQLLMGTLSFVITYLPNLANFRHFCHWAHFWTWVSESGLNVLKMK